MLEPESTAPAADAERDEEKKVDVEDDEEPVAVADAREGADV